MLNHVLVTRSYHSADCDTDHSLVCSKVRLRPRRIHRSKQKGRPRINTTRMSVPELRERFARAIDEAFENCSTDSATERWNHIRDAVYRCASDTFGKRERKNEDWFEAGSVEMELAIAAKRAALLEHKREPTEKTLATLRQTRNNAQRIARVKIAPLKSASGVVITDRSKQMERWAEHYQELYSRENIVPRTAIENTTPLPTMEELDAPPTMKELGEAIDSLACGKAPGIDGIPPEVIKAGKDSSLLYHLHELLLQCWEEGTVPQDMRDAKIIKLYKNKGDRSDCNNYRGISLLSVVGKAFARVILNRLQLLAERVYPEAQCGFRAARSTIDMVFSLR